MMLTFNWTTLLAAILYFGGTIQALVEIAVEPNPVQRSCGKENWLMESGPEGSKSPLFYPWMVSIGDQLGNSVCGGTIINDHEIITAAHCIQFIQPDNLRVLIGTDDLSKAELADWVSVTSTRVHPLFKKTEIFTYENDLAILTVPSLTFGPNVLPICLPSHYENFENEEAKVLGWGQVSQTKTGLAQTLQELELNIKPNKECSRIWGFEIGGNFLCFGEPMENVCTGDDGGPLMRYDTRADAWTLIGILSAYGPTCGDEYPALYSNVWWYADWITGDIALA